MRVSIFLQNQKERAGSERIPAAQPRHVVSRAPALPCIPAAGFGSESLAQRGYLGAEVLGCEQEMEPFRSWRCAAGANGESKFQGPAAAASQV